MCKNNWILGGVWTCLDPRTSSMQDLTVKLGSRVEFRFLSAQTEEITELSTKTTIAGWNTAPAAPLASDRRFEGQKEASKRSEDDS